MNPDQILGGMPAMPGMPQPGPDGQAPITDEQYQNLTDLLGSVKEKTAQIGSNEFVLANQKEQAQRDALKKIFDELAANGIDLNDQASVAAFLTQLQQSNPDLYQLFEEAMTILLGGNEMTNEKEAIPGELPGVPEDLREPQAEPMGGPVLPPEHLGGQPPEGGISIPLP